MCNLLKKGKYILNRNSAYLCILSTIDVHIQTYAKFQGTPIYWKDLGNRCLHRSAGVGVYIKKYCFFFYYNIIAYITENMLSGDVYSSIFQSYVTFFIFYAWNPSKILLVSVSTKIPSCWSIYFKEYIKRKTQLKTF